MKLLLIVVFISVATANNCGLRTHPLIPTNNSHVVEGASIKWCPWSVSVQFAENDDVFFHRCGGVVISNNWIITAAHCVFNKKPDELLVVLGSTDVNNKSGSYFETKIKNIIVHKAFNFMKRTFENDIALLQTKQTIPTSAAINTICLPDEKQVFSGRGLVSGWGYLNEDMEDGNDLLNVIRVNIYDESDCKSFYRSKFIASKMMCAGYASGSKNDACWGNGGSPLEKTINGRSYLVGIVSFGQGCGRKYYPTIYTKVSSYVNWIKKKINITNEDFNSPIISPVNENRENNSCGIRKNKNSYRIVGGRPAEKNEFPWTVSLQTTDGTHSCGAALISNRWIITAAHCVYWRKPKEMRALLGNIDWADENESVITRIEKLVVHPHFDRESKANDIALLKTTDKIPTYLEKPNINAICLPHENKEFSGRSTVTGWGHDEEEGQVSDTLKALPVNLYDDSDCETFYKERFNSSQMLCAGYVKLKFDSCQGDSGGPLEITVNGKTFLIGIVSFGEGCAREGYPGVYAKVSKYVNWIKNVTAEAGKENQSLKKIESKTVHEENNPFTKLMIELYILISRLNIITN